MSNEDILRKHKEALVEAANSQPFVVFLCGPSLKPGQDKPSAHLRASLLKKLGDEGFIVVLGEDDGLENARVHGGINAQDNELEFVSNECNAVVLIADSVGSYCELGLFSWHAVHADGSIVNGTRADLIVLVDEEYEADKSYLNEGPVNAVMGFGRALYVDFRAYTGDEVVTRLRSRRGVYTVDRRGRSRAKSP